MRVGLLGTGLMGSPMAVNLARAGTDLTVWNRTPTSTAPAVSAGACAVAEVDDVFARCDVVIGMLAHERAVDAVLGRGTDAFARRLSGRTYVHAGTTSPTFSAALERDVLEVGGRYVEAPVSGSRGPAERGELVVMLAGDPDAVADVEPLLTPIGRDAVHCGPVPRALTTKLAVNLYLVVTVAALAEAVTLARAAGLDPAVLARVLDAGPMASDVSRTKLRKLLAGDLTAQAAVTDVHTNARLVTAAARDAGVASPLADASRALYARAEELGHGGADMIAVIRAFEDAR